MAVGGEIVGVVVVVVGRCFAAGGIVAGVRIRFVVAVEGGRRFDLVCLKGREIEVIC